MASVHTSNYNTPSAVNVSMKWQTEGQSRADKNTTWCKFMAGCVCMCYSLSRNDNANRTKCLRKPHLFFFLRKWHKYFVCAKMIEYYHLELSQCSSFNTNILPRFPAQTQFPGFWLDSMLFLRLVSEFGFLFSIREEPHTCRAVGVKPLYKPDIFLYIAILSFFFCTLAKRWLTCGQDLRSAKHVHRKLSCSFPLFWSSLHRVPSRPEL